MSHSWVDLSRLHIIYNHLVQERMSLLRWDKELELKCRRNGGFSANMRKFREKLLITWWSIMSVLVFSLFESVQVNCNFVRVLDPI